MAVHSVTIKSLKHILWKTPIFYHLPLRHSIWPVSSHISNGITKFYVQIVFVLCDWYVIFNLIQDILLYLYDCTLLHNKRIVVLTVLY